MIVSFRHKGLEELYKKGKSRKIDPRHWNKLLIQMTIINQLTSEKDIMIFRNWLSHKLTGQNPAGQTVDGHWSLKVSGNWRLTYFFDQNGNVILTDCMDYH